MYQTTDWKGNPVWELENGDRVDPDIYVDVSNAKPLPALKRDKVYGMCAETRRGHTNANKRRWHAQEYPYGPYKYSPEKHIEAYADALGVSIDAAEDLIQWHNELLELHPQVIEVTS